MGSAQRLQWVHETFRHCHKAIIALHTDEASPHIHVMMIPETENARLGWTLVKPEVTGHETDHYRHLQNDFHERVAQRFGLDRGEVGSKRKHKPLTREAGIAAAREELDVGRELQRRLSKVADLADASMQPDKAAVIRQAAEDPDRLLEEMAQRNMERAERQAGPAFKQRLAELQKQEEEAEREAERKIAENKARVAASKLQAERWDAICRKKPSVFGKLLASAGG